MGAARLAAGASVYSFAERLSPAVPPATPLLGHRFATLCILIRTTPWEVPRDVKLLARDESAWHTLERVHPCGMLFPALTPKDASREASLNALEDQRRNYQQIRDYAVACQQKFGDEVSYFPAYFPAMYLPRERVNR